MMLELSELDAPVPSPDTGLALGGAASHLLKKRQAIRCALRGLRECWHTQPNLRLHGYLGGLVAALGWWCRLSIGEWLWLILAIGFVIIMEMINTAIEQTVDLVVGLTHDPLARQAKDIAAGCVLAAAALAALIGTLTFGRHFLNNG